MRSEVTMWATTPTSATTHPSARSSATIAEATGGCTAAPKSARVTRLKTNVAMRTAIDAWTTQSRA